MFLFNRNTWDLIHTWGAIVMIIAAILHFTIHWGWAVKVTTKMFNSLKPAVRSKIPAQPIKGLNS
jgi:hypothetical protein